MKRFGNTEEVADVAILSRSEYLTGQVIAISGLTMHDIAEFGFDSLPIIIRSSPPELNRVVVTGFVGNLSHQRKYTRRILE